MLNSFTFNGRSSEEFGIRVERFPNLNRSARKYKTASVPGRNGNIYQMENAWEEVVVSYQIFAGSRQQGCSVDSFTEIIEWLHSADDYAELTDTYDPSHYRMAVFVDSVDVESSWHKFGRATIQFRCRPERYIVSSPITISTGDGSEVIANRTNHIAKPIIRLTGSGARTMLNLSGRTLRDISYIANTEQLANFVPVMDTEYFVVRAEYVNREIIRLQWTGSGKATVGTMTNTNGQLTFTRLTADDFGVGIVKKVDSGTSYTLSGEANGYGMIYIVFAQDSGYHNTTRWQSKILYPGSGWTPFSFTFTTPSDCGYIMIIFSSPTPVGEGTYYYRKLMLNIGSEALPFREYATSSPSEIAVGGTKITMDGAFDHAVIDCERENVAFDGVDVNGKTTVLDEFDNLSVDFLQLEKGDNPIAFSGEITGVSVEPRFWEL